ncbi:MAG: hypothetical protein COT71_00775 [Candidatus Andersenbacteria bacterium CG10_big_fil_rev_8_21_14_0_10_54_11]|uniref:DUF721 domain-containing protein n=1 Tax=Candidatus Andersenbacteria bacterium CG10_big_fil_rev_8_21_14_0_10_54_11 TaxID=1974485 RepID=A0A2M6X026_9BACT|nr:MAG: hypothetical protein COT71_00775 [Candidatus Andersenbacteria bacterium CG10_big_fil_rev_8_21_14_0_10_54_11]
MSFQSLREALGGRLPAAPILEEGDIQYAVEELLCQYLPRAAFQVRVTPRRVKITALSPAVRQTALLLQPDIIRLLDDELQVSVRAVYVTQW